LSRIAAKVKNRDPAERNTDIISNFDEIMAHECSLRDVQSLHQYLEASPPRPLVHLHSNMYVSEQGYESKDFSFASCLKSLQSTEIQAMVETYIMGRHMRLAIERTSTTISGQRKAGTLGAILKHVGCSDGREGRRIENRIENTLIWERLVAKFSFLLGDGEELYKYIFDHGIVKKFPRLKEVIFELAAEAGFTLVQTQQAIQNQKISL
jgi:hypothetical protein